MLKLFPFSPYHEFRDGRFHTDEGSHFATIDIMNNRKRAIIVTMGDKQEVLADTSADLYRMVRGYIIRYPPIKSLAYIAGLFYFK